MPAVHLVIPTHTPRHLATVLAGVARQTRPPETVVVSCDTDDPAIGRVMRDLWGRAAPRAGSAPVLLHVARPHQGVGRVSQVRNNALRALDSRGRLADDDLVVFIDGDMLLAENASEKHHRLAEGGAECVIPFRVNLDEARTAAISPERVLSGELRVESLALPAELRTLRERDHRYRRQLVLRSLRARTGLPVIKPHKPKLLGGHHAVTVRRLRAVNGFDEQFLGYAWEDDDLSRRLNALRPRVRTVIAVRDIMAFHLWHPTQASGDPLKDRGYQRFSTPGLPVFAEHGWSDPLPQPDPLCVEVAGTAVASANAPAPAPAPAPAHA